MTEFISAQDMFDHLSTIIDDEEFIMRAVKVNFPEYKRQRNASKEMVIRSPHKETRVSNREPHLFVKVGPSYNSELSDSVYKTQIKRGSDELLEALHKHHPSIMNALKARGNQVVYPTNA